jgi:hypothetical protein
MSKTHLCGCIPKYCMVRRMCKSPAGMTLFGTIYSAVPAGLGGGGVRFRRFRFASSTVNKVSSLRDFYACDILECIPLVLQHI